MTSTVIVKAHCTDEKEVVVIVRQGGKEHEVIRLNDGDVAERVVFDEREIFIREQLK